MVFNVLWTSGWDSTYRVAELVLNHGATVQPHYVVDPGRDSTNIELAVQEELRHEFARLRAGSELLLLPSVLHQMATIPTVPAITESFQRLRATGHLGSQYDWLSRLAYAKNINDLELCIHQDDKAAAFLGTHVERRGVGMAAHHALMVDSLESDLWIFRPFRFPLFDLTKLDMAERASAGNFSSLMEMTWFCFSPGLGRLPCGFCNPCRYTREEGLGRRVPPASPRRAVEWRLLNVVRRVRRVRRRAVAAIRTRS